MERITDRPDGQADISAQEAASRQGAWVPRPDEDHGRSARARDAARPRPEAALGLTVERGKDDMVAVPTVHFVKENGELSSVTIDAQTKIELLDEAGTAG